MRRKISLAMIHLWGELDSSSVFLLVFGLLQMECNSPREDFTVLGLYVGQHIMTLKDVLSE